MELYFLKMYKIPKRNFNRKFLTSVHTRHRQPLPYFDLYSEFLSRSLWTYTDSVCPKYWPRARNVLVVHSEILLMKNKIRFTRGKVFCTYAIGVGLFSHFSPGYPTFRVLVSMWNCWRGLNRLIVWKENTKEKEGLLTTWKEINTQVTENGYLIKVFYPLFGV